MKLFDLVRRQSRALLFTIAVLTASGIALMLHLPVSLFPDVTFPRIVILADNGEEPPERMMVEVTRPLEEVASSVPGIQVVRSITGRGSTEISLGLDWGTNVQQTLQLLQGRIANARNQLPASASIQAEQMTVSVFPVHGYSLTSETLDQVQLRDIALYQIRPALLRVKGVARVEVVGGDTREFRITVSPEKLASYHLDIRQVSDAIRKTNLLASPGLVTANYQLYLSLVSGQLHTFDEIRSVVVAVQNGIPVRVSDLAEVSPSVADRYIRTTAHGREAVLINILKQPTGSTVQIGQDVNAVVANLKLPGGVHFENFYDQGNFINSSIQSTRDSIIIGIILAMMIIAVFLRNWRVTIVMMFVVPATIASTFVCLSAVGLTINIMTLGGIAAAVGLIIDDAIVIVENIFKQSAHARGSQQTPSEVIGTSLHNLMPAIIGSTASTIVIHIPLAFLGGVTGAFFASLSITMVFAMLISFLFSITLVPLLASFVLRDKDIESEIEREERATVFSAWYERVLRRLLKARFVAIPFAIIILLAAWFLYNHIGSSFMPEMDEGTFVLDYATPSGTSLEETDRILMNVEKILMSIPEVESYSRRTGTQLGFFLTEANTGDYLVKLKQNRSRDINEVITEVRHRTETSEPALRIEFGQLMMDVIGDLTNNPSPVEIKIFNDDPVLLRNTAAQIKNIIETIPGVVDAFDGVVIAGPSMIVHVDPFRTARAGLTVDDVSAQLETMMHGSAETNIQKGEKLMNIRIRFPETYRTDADQFENTRLVNSSGTFVLLRSIASIERTAGQAEVHREGLRQMLSVTARIEGRDLGRTIEDIKTALASKLTLPQGMTLEYGGVYQTQQESFRGLLLVALAAFVLVFLVLLIEFREFAVPFSIFVINLLSLVGVFGALWITGVSFNISSFVGIIMIIGIVAENAIFVMHRVHELRLRKLPLDDALVQAGQMRARPILMTTLAAVLALLPLSLGIGAGAQMQQPLAIAVIGGFSVSSLFLFFGLPVVYKLFARDAKER
jgi:CzcA family heavy metal efflux pump